MWWGTLGFMALEGMGFALAAATYLYLANSATEWPLSVGPPNLWPGTIVLVVLLLSLVPNHILARHARRCTMRQVRLWLVVMSVAGIVPLVVRAFEFPALKILWDANAYGSIVWILLGLHTMHLLTDLGDTWSSPRSCSRAMATAAAGSAMSTTTHSIGISWSSAGFRFTS